MDLLPWVRKEIVSRLWSAFKSSNPHVQLIEQKLAERGETLTLDHLALLDLPGPHSGISVLKEIFESIGFNKRGQDYLPEKQNEYVWLAEPGIERKDFNEALPQIIVSDFRISDLSYSLKNLVAKYADQAKAAPLAEIKNLAIRCEAGDESSIHSLVDTVVNYLSTRSFPLPTKKDFEIMRHENELVAWTSIFSKQINHFSIGGHSLKTLASITELNDFIVSQCGLKLNYQGGSSVKGSLTHGIAQSAIVAERTAVALEDGPAVLPFTYVEFAWRFPKIKSVNRPLLWSDYFTDFISANANQVIESVYSRPSSHIS